MKERNNLTAMLFQEEEDLNLPIDPEIIDSRPYLPSTIYDNKMGSEPHTRGHGERDAMYPRHYSPSEAEYINRPVSGPPINRREGFDMESYNIPSASYNMDTAGPHVSPPVLDMVNYEAVKEEARKEAQMEVAESLEGLVQANGKNDQ